MAEGTRFVRILPTVPHRFVDLLLVHSPTVVDDHQAFDRSLTNEEPYKHVSGVSVNGVVDEVGYSRLQAVPGSYCSDQPGVGRDMDTWAVRRLDDEIGHISDPRTLIR